MDTGDSRRDASQIVAHSNRALVQRSNELVRRGLSLLSSGDAATFVELGKALTSSLNLDQVQRAMMEKLDEYFQPDSWYLLLLDEKKEELYVELAVGKGSSKLKDLRIRLGDGIAGWVAQQGEAVVVTDARKDPRFLQEVDGWPEDETRTIVAIPVRFQERCVGVIGLVNYCGEGGVSQQDLSLLRTFADFLAIGLRNAQFLALVQERAIANEPSRLFNAQFMETLLETEVNRAQRDGLELSLVYVDPNNLKDLSHSLSYVHFSKLLSELGQALRGKLRQTDSAYYMGDGEFTALLPQTTKKEGLLTAQRLHKLFREGAWLRAEGQNVWLPARVAVATFPEDGKTKAELFDAVFEAMNRLKESSADGVVVANGEILSPH